MLECKFLSQIEIATDKKIGCPLLSTCTGANCTNPDSRVREVATENQGVYFEQSDAEQEQILRTLEMFREVGN